MPYQPVESRQVPPRLPPEFLNAALGPNFAPVILRFPANKQSSTSVSYLIPTNINYGNLRSSLPEFRSSAAERLGYPTRRIRIMSSDPDQSFPDWKN